MAKYLSDHILERVRQATDIVALVRDTVPLKKAGSGFLGLCPFHKEKTPSFNVNPERQLFKCFGCGAGGDVFSFVMKQEGMNFGEALRHLAERAHIELPESEYEQGQRGERAQLYEINAWAASVFHRCLVERPMGKEALEYLRKRGLTDETIKRFQIGYSPDTWDGILKAGRKKKFSEELMLRAGLLASNEQSGRMYDRFRNRVMFPILDAQDRVIGFGARCLDGSEPKYLNSPETPLFSKGRTLYAIDRAKEPIREKRQAIVVEGYMDAIMAHQHGIAWTVGVLGTALSRDHVRVLRRFAEETVLLFDADNAGQSSSARSIDAFAAEEMPVRVASLPDGLDPDEFLEQHGIDAFLKCIESGVDGVSYKLERALEPAGEGPSESAPMAVSKALDDVLGTVAQIPNAVTQAQEIRRIAGRAGVTEWALQQRLAQVAAQGTRERAEAAPSAPAGRSIEREILQALMSYPETASVFRARLDVRRLRDEQVRALVERALAMADAGESCAAEHLLARTREDALRAVLDELVTPEPVKIEDPIVWSSELIREIEARAHARTGQELHHQMLNHATASREDQDRLLHERLAALRAAHDMRGRLHLKRNTEGGVN